jgi:hypothetical protein
MAMFGPIKPTHATNQSLLDGLQEQHSGKPASTVGSAGLADVVDPKKRGLAQASVRTAKWPVARPQNDL